MNKEQFEFFIVKKTEKGTLIDFEADTINAERAIIDVIKYLKRNQIDFIHNLKIGDILVRISRFCPDDIVYSDYLDKLNEFQQ